MTPDEILGNDRYKNWERITPPQGDVDVGEAKRIVNRRVTLMGSIDFSDLKFVEPDEIEGKVLDARIDNTTWYTKPAEKAT